MRKQLPAIEQLSILIVDDHPAIREGLAQRIASEPGMKVCGEADGQAAALAVVAAHAPAVAVIDIGLKGCSGIELVERIKAKSATVRMLIWTMYAESHYAERALRAGALGFLTKDQPTAQVIDAIKHVAKGQIYLSKEMQERLVRRSVGLESQEVFEIGSFDKLSNRELEVFRLIGQALDTRAIAQNLHLSPKTVETYQAHIKGKLNLGSIRELVSCAVRWHAQIQRP